jgi:hypothetical protein
MESEDKKPQSFLSQSAYESPETGDLGTILKKRILEQGGEYKEVIPVNPDGSLGIKDPRNKRQSLIAPLVSENTTDIYYLAEELEKMFPELRFNFNRSLENETITMTVSLHDKIQS